MDAYPTFDRVSVDWTWKSKNMKERMLVENDLDIRHDIEQED